MSRPTDSDGFEKRATLKELRSVAAETGEIQVRSKVEFVTQAGSTISYETRPPVSLELWIKDLLQFVKPMRAQIKGIHSEADKGGGPR